MNKKLYPAHWLQYWFSEGEEAVSHQEGWDHWWHSLGKLKRSSGFRTRQQILSMEDPDPATEAFLTRYSEANWSGTWPLYGTSACIPLIGIEFADLSVWDITQGRAVFCASQGHWRYLENRRYRDMFSEIYALSPRHFLVSVCDDGENFADFMVQRAESLNLAALLLKRGTVADPAKSVVTLLRSKGGLTRTGGVVFRSYSWSFRGENDVFAYLQSEVDVSDVPFSDDVDLQDQMGGGGSVETTKLSTSKYSGDPIVITAEEVDEFLNLLDLVEYARGNDILSEPEDFAIRCFLGIHDLWYDERYKLGLLFSCFEAVIGRLSFRNRDDCINLISAISAASRNENMAPDAVFDMLLLTRNRVAHGNMEASDGIREFSDLVVDLLRYMLKSAILQKSYDHSHEKLPKPKSANYLKQLQRGFLQKNPAK